ncbi:unnamed protein product [Mucor fragilis]
MINKTRVTHAFKHKNKPNKLFTSLSVSYLFIMGAAFEYFARTSIDTFCIKEFLDKQKCDSRESSRTKFVQFVTSIRDSKSMSDNMSKAKKLAKHFIQANFDILSSEEFVDYWTERERSQTRSIRRATNTHAALDQANTV